MTLLKKMREKWNIKKTGIVVGTLCTSLFLFSTKVYGVRYYYKDCEFLWDYLMKDDFFNTIKKGIGNVIFDIICMFIDPLEGMFQTIARLDIIELTKADTIINNIDVLMPPLLLIFFIVAVFAYVFKLENPLKAIINMLIICLSLVCFSTFVDLGTEFKNAMLTETDNLIGKKEYPISQKIYAENTVDVMKSLKEGEVAYLDVENMDSIDREQRINKSSSYTIYDYPYLIDGTVNEITYRDLQDGLFGQGDVRYFRYSTDFWSVNVTLLASILVYFLGIFKLSLQVVSFFKLEIYGRFAMMKGMFDYRKIKDVLQAFATNILGVLVTYASMTLFSIFCSGIMSSELNWIACAILIYSFGLSILIGSSEVNKLFGVNDNFRDVMAGTFMLGRMGRMAGKVGKKIGGGLKKGYEYGKGKVDKSYDDEVEKYQDDFYDNLYNNDKLKDALNEDRYDWDVQQAKEKMYDKHYQDTVSEDAKRQIYGDDYKMQEEMSKIKEKSDSFKTHDEAMKKVYGDDYAERFREEKLRKKAQEYNMINDYKETLNAGGMDYFENKDEDTSSSLNEPQEERKEYSQEEIERLLKMIE